jgi:7-cyano-7-deazaguanine synthase in queuosine biosynthesis
MRLVCGPAGLDFQALRGDLDVVLYGRGTSGRGSAGAAIVETLQRKKLSPHPRAWDFLSIALAVTAADLAGHRSLSGDGWTREFELRIAVADPDFWATQATTLQELLQFLTTDRWSVAFVPGASYPAQPAQPVWPDHDSVVLFSGGLDSFTGALDLVEQGRRPFAVSQSVRGDAEKQRALAIVVSDTIGQLQLNHNVVVPAPENPPSQRGRSVIFFAYGILAASALRRYVDGNEVDIFVCENGFIALNPPLTGSRLGSLSTRTCHPVVLALLQQVLQAAGLRVRVRNPFASHTKGEVLARCARQQELRAQAHGTTSCGRFKRFGYRHCGRCVPCLIRRAAFHAWSVPDKTHYVYTNIGVDDPEHARSDDVRATAMAIADVADGGLDQWLGAALSSPLIGESAPMYRAVAERGLRELERFLTPFGVK